MSLELSLEPGHELDALKYTLSLPTARPVGSIQFTSLAISRGAAVREELAPERFGSLRELLGLGGVHRAPTQSFSRNQSPPVAMNNVSPLTVISSHARHRPATLTQSGAVFQTRYMGGTMAWRIEGRLNVAFHGTRAPTNLEWQRYVIDAVSSAASETTRVVVLSRGGSPDARQREALMTALRGRPKPMALLTDQLIARAAIATMNIFNRTMKAFPTKGLKEAAEFLQLTIPERERVAQLLVELEKQVGENTASSESTAADADRPR